jgi:hypothetical protein
MYIYDEMLLEMMLSTNVKDRQLHCKILTTIDTPALKSLIKYIHYNRYLIGFLPTLYQLMHSNSNLCYINDLYVKLNEYIIREYSNFKYDEIMLETFYKYFCDIKEILKDYIQIEYKN